MAKLNGVKTIDMQNGKITKVAYEGAEYAKVEGKAEVGDLVLNVSETAFFTLGAFYLAFDTYSTGEPRMKDDDNDNLGMGEGNYALFRKISAQSEPTLEQVAKRVETLESDVAALKSSGSSLKGEKVDEEPKRLTRGDIAKVISRGSEFKGEVGDIVKIVKDDKSDYLYECPYECERISDGKDVGWFFESELEAYSEEAIEFEGATYRKVEREAREGDVVIIRNGTGEWFMDGVPYKVLQGILINSVHSSGKMEVYKAAVNRTRETVDVYEPIEQAKYVPQEGDIVVIVKSEHGSRNGVGDIGKVSDVSPINFAVDVPQKPDARNVNGNKHETYEVRKATPAEVEKYEQAIYKASFSVGEYVKIVKSHRGLEGVIAKITEIGEYPSDVGITCDFGIEHLTGKYAGETLVATADQIVKATDTEIAKATGPKLKVGDFVKFKRGISDTKADKPYLIEVDPSGGELAFRDDVNDWCSIAHSSEYEILSAEEAKWAKIGRKPNEFKKGDVVRVLGVCSGHEIAGQLGEIVIADGSDQPRVRAVYEDELIELWTRVELVAPVESIFNA